MIDLEKEKDRTKASFMFNEWLPAYLESVKSTKNALIREKQMEDLREIESRIDRKTYYRVCFDLVCEANRIGLMIGNDKVKEKFQSLLSTLRSEGEEVNDQLNRELLRITDTGDKS